MNVMSADEVMRYLIQENMVDIFVEFCKKQLGEAPAKEYVFHPVRKWRFDYAFPEAKIALEVEGGVYTGGRHIRPKGFLGDVDKYNAAAVMGWRVLRVVPDRLRTFDTIKMIRDCMDYGKELQEGY